MDPPKKKVTYVKKGYVAKDDKIIYQQKKPKQEYKQKPQYVAKEVKYMEKQQPNKTQKSKQPKPQISSQSSNTQIPLSSASKRLYKLKDVSQQSEYLPIKDKIEQGDLRILKKNLLQILNLGDKNFKAEGIVISYKQDQPIIIFEYVLKGIRDSTTLKDLMEANSKLKKNKPLIKRIYDSLYRKVDKQFYDIGFFGLEMAQQKRLAFRNRNFKQCSRTKIVDQYLFYYAIKNQRFNFIIFDSALNSIKFNTNNIADYQRRYQKQFQVYKKFQKLKLKDLKAQDFTNETYIQQQIDSDQQYRQKKIAKQKQPALKQLRTKLQRILNKDITDFLQRIQEKNDNVTRATGQQSQLVQKLAQQVMQQQNSVDNFSEVRQYVRKKIEQQFSSDQQQLKVTKNCLKRIIIAQKQLQARLPIISRKRQIFEKLNKHNLIILEGQTGSGKSTQLPQILCQYYNIFDNQKALPVLITQPRKLATRTLAQRVANQMEQNVHGFVDYQTSLTTRVNENAKIIFKMDRLVLDQLKNDPKLSKYCCLVIDQAHQRTISIDVILGLIKKLLSLRSDFKIIVTSASMDTKLFKSYFKTQILKVSGRMFPVQEKFYPIQNQRSTVQKIKKVINRQLLNDNQQNLRPQYRGHILVFCSGVDQINQLYNYFNNKLNKRVFRVHALHGKLTPEQQREVFIDSQQFKIIFSTRIAETSITINNVKVVIDPGQDRELVYDQKNKVTSMKLKKISQSSAKQRLGRAGRTNQGYCFRLYSKIEKNELSLNKTPQIQNMALDSVVLRLKSLQIQDILNFPYLSPPSREGLQTSIQLMKMINCLDEKTGKITSIGQFLVKIPIQPFLARSLVQAMLMQKILSNHKNILNQLSMNIKQIDKLTKLSIVQEIIRILCLVVSASNLFFIKQQNRQQAQRKKFEKLKDEDGDFFFLRNIYQKYLQFVKNRQINQLKRWTRQYFLSQKVLSQTRDLQKQINQIIKQFPIRNQSFDSFYIQVKDKLTDANTIRELLLSCLISSFATNLALKSFSQRNNQSIGYTIFTNQLPMQIYGSSILCLQGICPKWIFYYDLYQNQKGQMYCKIAHSVDFKFLLKNTTPYIIRKFNLNEAQKANPYYNCISKTLPTLTFMDIYSDYQKKHYNQNKKLNFLEKFHINFDQQHSKIDFYYKKDQSIVQKDIFDLFKQKMNQLLKPKPNKQSVDPKQTIQNYINQVQEKYKKSMNYNYVGYIYIRLSEGFNLLNIQFQVREHIYKVIAREPFSQYIYNYCSIFGNCQIYGDKMVFTIRSEQERKQFQNILQILIKSFRQNNQQHIKYEHHIQDSRKKIPYTKLFMHFWAGQSDKKNIYLTFNHDVDLDLIIQDIQKGRQNLRKLPKQQNKLLGLQFKIAKSKKGINCLYYKLEQFDEIELYEILQKYNRQKIFPYTFKMPRNIQKFRQPDISLSTKSQKQWEKIIRNILKDQNIQQENVQIRVWGRQFYSKEKKVGALQEKMKIQMHAQIKCFDFRKLTKFKQKNDKKTKVIGTEKVHIKFQFQQTAVVTNLKAFQALSQQFKSIQQTIHERYPLVTIQNYQRTFRNLTKVYVKIRSANRDQLIWPTILITNLFTPKLIPLPQIKFRFLDKTQEGNQVLEDMQIKYNYKIYFSFERRSLTLKVYCQDQYQKDIQEQLLDRINQFNIFSQEISYRGKNLNKVKQICQKMIDQIRHNNLNGRKFFDYEIIFKFRKIKITGNSQTCDQVKNQIMKLVNRQKQQCQICSDVLQRPFRLFNCRHQFCQLCLISYIRESISNAGSQLLKCPGCPVEINVYDVQKIMTEQQFNKFCDIRIARFIEKSKDYHQCYSPNCENIFKSQQTNRNQSFECELCGKWYCIKCKSSHQGYNCDQWKNKLDDALLLKLDIKKCPNCKQGIQKNKGCQHMTCLKCQKHICWNCLKYFDDSKACYDHLAKQCGGIFRNNPGDQ